MLSFTRAALRLCRAGHMRNPGVDLSPEQGLSTSNACIVLLKIPKWLNRAMPHSLLWGYRCKGSV
jgi:hypothetical protein